MRMRRGRDGRISKCGACMARRRSRFFGQVCNFADAEEERARKSVGHHPLASYLRAESSVRLPFEMLYQVPERTKVRAESKRWLAKDPPENESESALRLLRGHGEIWKGRRRIGRAQNILNKIALNNNNKNIGAIARWCSAYKSLMALAISSGSHLRRRARRTKTMKRSGTVCVRDKSERYTAQDRVRGAWRSALGYVRASRTLFKRTITQDDVCLTVAMLVGRGSKNNAA